MVHAWIAILSLGLVVGGNLVVKVWADKSDSASLEWFAPAIPAIIVAAMSFSCAAALGLWRFFVYGMVFVVVGETVASLKLEPWVGLLAGGGAVTAWGAVLLFRFLREFAVLSNEVEA